MRCYECLLTTYTSPDIRPHTEGILRIERKKKLPSDKELYLDLFFALRKAVSWAPAGHIVATGQVQLSPPRSVASLLGSTKIPSLHEPLSLWNHQPALSVAHPLPHVLHITTSTPSHTAWTFDLLLGQLTSWTRSQDPTNILATPLTFDIYRALTNNDAGGDDPAGAPGSQGRQWRDARVHLAHAHSSALDGQASAHWEHKHMQDGTDVVEVTVHSRIAPPVLSWGIDVTSTYRFMANSKNSIINDDVVGGSSHDALHIHVQAKASGPWLPPTLPRFGLTTRLRDCHAATWFGRGPGESYRDKKASQLLGTYTRAMDDGLFTHYEVPQENGNRTDVRWVAFFGRKSGEATTTTTEEGGEGEGGIESPPGLRTGLEQLEQLVIVEQQRGGLVQGAEGAAQGKLEAKKEKKPPCRRHASASASANASASPLLLRAWFGDLAGASFSAGRYTTRELDAARHPFELENLLASRGEGGGSGTTTAVVHLDWVHHGLGTGSCGPETLPQYSLSQKEFDFDIILD